MGKEGKQIAAMVNPLDSSWTVVAGNTHGLGSKPMGGVEGKRLIQAPLQEPYTDPH
tara:strand:- start:13 stop:180 length:168 start_codon:yes stop_codon:yes gene_type:complete